MNLSDIVFSPGLEKKLVSLVYWANLYNELILPDSYRVYHKTWNFKRTVHLFENVLIVQILCKGWESGFCKHYLSELNMR